MTERLLLHDDQDAREGYGLMMEALSAHQGKGVVYDPTIDIYA